MIQRAGALLVQILLQETGRGKDTTWKARESSEMDISQRTGEKGRTDAYDQWQLGDVRTYCSDSCFHHSHGLHRKPHTTENEP